MLKKLIPIATSSAVRAVKNKTPLLANIRSTSNVGGVYEPDYLDSLKPEFPQYESLNVQIKGYDFPILESYQRFLHNVAEYMDIDVSDCYAMPPQYTKVQRLRPNSNVIDADYKLIMYERNLQLNDVNAPMYPLFLRVAQQALPEGVQLLVQEHTDDVEERRYVPDKELIDLKSELERMQSGKK